MSDSTQIQAKPSIPLIVVSLLVIIASLFLLSAAIASFVVLPYPCLICAGPFLTVPSLLLAFQQYRGTFRRVYEAASMTSKFLFLLGGLAIAATLFSFSIVNLDAACRGFLGYVAPPVAVSLALIVSGYVNLRWARVLDRDWGELPQPPLTFTIR